MLLPKRGAGPETVDRQTLAASVGHLPRTFSILLDTGIYNYGKANEVLRLASQAGNEDQQGCYFNRTTSTLTLTMSSTLS